MRTYLGSRSPGPRADGTAITVTDTDGREYPLRFVDQWEHGRRFYDDHAPVPDTPASRRHEWGYNGSGPASTAASILADHLGEPAPRRLVQRFKHDVICGLPRRERWTLTSAQIEAFLDRHRTLIETEAAEVARYQQHKMEDT